MIFLDKPFSRRYLRGNSPGGGIPINAQLEIQEKIRALRSQKGYSLTDLSRATGLSKGYLSKIENALSIPPVSTLRRIGTALGVNLTYFFSRDTSEAHQRKIVVVRNKDRQEFGAELRESGIKRWPLAERKFGRNMNPFIIEIPPDNSQVFQFEGEEFYLLLEGRVELCYGGDTYILEAGDSVYLDADVPYTGRSLGGVPARSLMVQYYYRKVTPKSFPYGLMNPRDGKRIGR